MSETPCLRCGRPTFRPPTCSTCDRSIGTPPVLRPEGDDEEVVQPNAEERAMLERQAHAGMAFRDCLPIWRGGRGAG